MGRRSKRQALRKEPTTPSGTRYDVAPSGTRYDVALSGMRYDVAPSGTRYDVALSGTRYDVALSGTRYDVAEWLGHVGHSTHFYMYVLKLPELVISSFVSWPSSTCLFPAG